MPRVSGLRPHPAGLICPGCGRVYPVVDGVPIVLRDVDAWLQQEAVCLLARADLPVPVLERVARGAGGPLLRDRRLQEVYAASQQGPLQDWVRATVAALRGRVLDLGCGSAVYDPDSLDARVVGIELNWTLVRAWRGSAVLGDALDPPFLAESFDAVLLLNLLDSCREPFLALQQADALLAPGGTLVLSCAFAWQDAVTPPDQRFDETFLLRFLGGRGYEPAPGHPRELDWPLVIGPRTRHVHRALALVASRPGKPASESP